MATINKTRPSCARVKVQVDLLFDFPKFVEVEVRNDDTKESRVEKVNIPYDMLLKYCKHCKVQGHEEEEYRVLHPKLRKNSNKEIIITDAEQMQKGKQQSECIMENQRRREVRKTWNPTK